MFTRRCGMRWLLASVLAVLAGTGRAEAADNPKGEVDSIARAIWQAVGAPLLLRRGVPTPELGAMGPDFRRAVVNGFFGPWHKAVKLTDKANAIRRPDEVVSHWEIRRSKGGVAQAALDLYRYAHSPTTAHVDLWRKGRSDREVGSLAELTVDRVRGAASFTEVSSTQSIRRILGQTLPTLGARHAWAAIVAELTTSGERKVELRLGQRGGVAIALPWRVGAFFFDQATRLGERRVPASGKRPSTSTR